MISAFVEDFGVLLGWPNRLRAMLFPPLASREVQDRPESAHFEVSYRKSLSLGD